MVANRDGGRDNTPSGRAPCCRRAGRGWECRVGQGHRGQEPDGGRETVDHRHGSGPRAGPQPSVGELRSAGSGPRDTVSTGPSDAVESTAETVWKCQNVSPGANQERGIGNPPADGAFVEPSVDTLGGPTLSSPDGGSCGTCQSASRINPSSDESLTPARASDNLAPRCIVSLLFSSWFFFVTPVW